MPLSFYYISNGKMHIYTDGQTAEIHSGVLDSYIYKVKDNAQRYEWKYNGAGAAFTGTERADVSPEDAVNAIHSSVSCVGTHNGDIIYSIRIDDTSGIYRKKLDASSTEGIVLCNSSVEYGGFDIKGDLMAASAAFAGESHIGIMDLTSQTFTTLTEGRSWDCSPTWSASEPNKVYFCCMGLPMPNGEEASGYEGPISLSQIVSEMYSASTAASRGPSSICLLDTVRGTLTELLSDESYDYTHPQSLSDGSFCYIRKPYCPSDGKRGALGCLADIIMIPVRLVEALFGFLNVFSAKYSGKTLSKSDVKSRDEKQMFIDGNLINAEKEIKANRRRGDENPGIIPRSWELRRRYPDGTDALIRKGVAAYSYDEKTEEFLVSNGSAVLKIGKDGKEKKLLAAQKVLFIKENKL